MRLRANRSASSLTRSNSILASHARWAETSGREGRPADLSGIDLRSVKGLAHGMLTALIAPGAVLYGLDLTGARLQGAHLEGADLRGAKLTGADLRGVNLKNAKLANAELARRQSRAAPDRERASAAGTARAGGRALCRLPRRRHAPDHPDRSRSRLRQFHRRDDCVRPISAAPCCKGSNCRSTPRSKPCSTKPASISPRVERFVQPLCLTFLSAAPCARSVVFERMNCPSRVSDTFASDPVGEP